MSTGLRKYIIKDIAKSGSTTLVEAVTGKRIFIKNVIVSVDSECDFYFCDNTATPKKLSNTFFNGAVGGFSATQVELNIGTPIGKALCINCSTAANVSMMLEVGFIN